MKPEIRAIGIDDGQFVPHSKSQVLVVGIVFRGGYWLDGVMSTQISNDGLDGTKRISTMILESPHYKQLRVIILNGITFAGLNVVDIQELNAKTGLPVIAVTSRKPNLAEVHAAINHLPDSQKRWSAVLNAGKLYSLKTKNGKNKIYFEVAGISKSIAEEILLLTSTRSKIPEALRVAHLVASGLTSSNDLA